MIKEDIENKIRNNCFEIATLLMWEADKIPVEKAEEQIAEISEMTEEFVEIAYQEFRIVESLGCKVESLQRAIDYLQVQAIPPLRGNLSWFKYSLGTLLELSFPNYHIEDGDLDFVEMDLKKRLKNQN